MILAKQDMLLEVKQEIVLPHGNIYWISKTRKETKKVESLKSNTSESECCN